MSRYKPLVYDEEPAFTVVLQAFQKRHKSNIYVPRDMVCDDNTTELRFKVIALPGDREEFRGLKLGDFVLVQAMEFNKPNMAWPGKDTPDIRITSSRYIVAIDLEPEDFVEPQELENQTVQGPNGPVTVPRPKKAAPSKIIR